MRTVAGNTVSVEIYWSDYVPSQGGVNRNQIGFYVWEGPIARQRMGMFGERDRLLADVYVEGGGTHDLLVFEYADDGPVTKHRIESNYIPARLDGKPAMLP